MKVGISKLVESALNDNKMFSVKSYDSIYTFRNEEITFSQRKDEISKCRSYMKPIMLHILMYCYPDKVKGSDSTIKNTERELINKWLLKISNKFLKIKNIILSKSMSPDMTKGTLNKLNNELKEDHNYKSTTKFELETIDELQQLFILNWDNLLAKKFLSNQKTINYSELALMLKNFKSSILKSYKFKTLKYQ